jgi:heme/copper-type cytochrome/quinol oxidase subunit 3
MSDSRIAAPTLPIGAVDRRGVGWWGLLTVIATEGALFVYLLFSYFYYDVQFGAEWRPGNPPLTLAIVNVVILLVSNAAAWFGMRGIQRGRRAELLAGFGLALILGLAFIAVQAIEWRDKSFSPESSTYGSVYYTISGFHLAHLVAGVLMLLAVLIWAAFGYFDRWRNLPVLIVTAYWNFVLAVWLAVFFTLYITPRLG